MLGDAKGLVSFLPSTQSVPGVDFWFKMRLQYAEALVRQKNSLLSRVFEE